MEIVGGSISDNMPRYMKARHNIEIENESVAYDDNTSDANNIKDDTKYNNEETIPTSIEEGYEPVMDDTDMLEETNIVTEDADNNLSNNMGIQEDSMIQDNEIEQSSEEITENDSTSDNNRYELRAKVREKLNKLQDERRSKSDSVIHTKKIIIPERVRY